MRHVPRVAGVLMSREGGGWGAGLLMKNEEGSSCTAACSCKCLHSLLLGLRLPPLPMGCRACPPPLPKHTSSKNSVADAPGNQSEGCQQEPVGCMYSAISCSTHASMPCTTTRQP